MWQPEKIVFPLVRECLWQKSLAGCENTSQDLRLIECHCVNPSWVKNMQSTFHAASQQNVNKPRDLGKGKWLNTQKPIFSVTYAASVYGFIQVLPKSSKWGIIIYQQVWGLGVRWGVYRYGVNKAGVFYWWGYIGCCNPQSTIREESSQTNVILQYKLLASILSAVCSVIQQSQYVLHFYYTLYDGKYDCKITTH